MGSRFLGLAGTERQKREHERAISFGPGRALLIQNALGSDIPIALVSTTTQRSDGGMDSATAFVSLVLALAEAIRYVPGRPVRSATIVLFRKDQTSDCEVDPVVVRRALALAAAPRHPQPRRNS
jgi:hypothetical protein